MKKLLVALLFLPALSWATFQPVTGSTVVATLEDGAGNKLTSTTNALDVNLKSGVTTVTGSTMTLQGSNGAGVTATSGALDINIKSGSIANTGFNVNNNVTLNALPIGTNNIGTVSGSTTSIQSGGVAITATSGALDMNIKSGSIANTGFNVNNTPSVLVGTVTIVTAVNNTTNLPVTVSNAGFNVTNAPNIGTVTTLTGITNALPAGGNTIGNIGNLNGVVISSFATTSTPQVNLTLVGSTTVTTAGGAAGELKISAQIAADSNTVTAVGAAAVGATVSGNPVYAGVDVASSTFPTLRTNGQGQYLLADPAGRLITVAGVPEWMVKQATITLTGTAPITLIASAAASNFNDLCGCIGTNTSATNTYVMFQSTGALGGGWPAADFPLGMPANDVPVGFGPVSCEHPVPQRAAASNWEVQAANAVTDLRLTCYYYTIAR